MPSTVDVPTTGNTSWPLLFGAAARSTFPNQESAERMNEAKTFKDAAQAFNALQALISEARGIQGDLRKETRAAKKLLGSTVEDRVEAEIQRLFDEMTKAINEALDGFYKELSEKQREAVDRMRKELEVMVRREIVKSVQTGAPCLCNSPSIVIDAR